MRFDVAFEGEGEGEGEGDGEGETGSEGLSTEAANAVLTAITTAGRIRISPVLGNVKRWSIFMSERAT